MNSSSPPARILSSPSSSPSFGQRDPDIRGYYGPYGGRFVPETLVAPVAELEAAYFAARSDRFVSRRTERAASPLCRTPDAALRSQASVVGARRRAPAAQARGSGAYRRAQDQQRARPGTARQADGEAPGHRRDRSRAARRCHGDSLRAPRARRATSTWAPTTWSGRRSTFSAWSCSGPRFARSTAAAAR